MARRLNVASKRAVIAAFGILDASGIPRPKSWQALDAAGIVEEWRCQLSGFDDVEVIAAVRAYCSSGEKFWPSVGQLVRCSPKRPKLLQSAPQPWCPAAQAVLDEVTAKHGPWSSWSMGRKVKTAERALELQDAHDAASP